MIKLSQLPFIGPYNPIHQRNRKQLKVERWKLISFRHFIMFTKVSTCLAASSAQFSRFFSKSLCGKAAALQIFDAGLKRADPYTAVYNYLKESKDSIDGIPVG